MLSGCRKATFEQCEQVCEHYVELHHWAEFAEKSAGLSEPEVAAMRAAYEAEWAKIVANTESKRRANCITECRRSATPEEAECMLESASTDAFSTCQD